MANVVRLVNGGAIQVRTGVLQGIGPQGPRGTVGSTGPQGEQGPIGETGEMGQILQQSGRTSVNTNNALAANTDSVISFGSVAAETTLRVFSNSADMFLEEPGDYLISCFLRFDDAAAGLREMWFRTGTTTIARTTRQSVAGAPFYVDLAFPYHAVGGEVVNVIARTSAALGISLGDLMVTRIGSGPQGPMGPPGAKGNDGPIGPQGPKGDPGTANSGFTKYSDMMPH